MRELSPSRSPPSRLKRLGGSSGKRRERCSASSRERCSAGERVEELYDVAILPGVMRPSEIGFRTGEIRFMVSPSQG